MRREQLLEEIGAVLAPVEGAAPQFGEHEDTGFEEALLCCSAAAFRERHPHLPQADPGVSDAPCIDLEVIRDGDRLVTARLEGLTPDEMLATVGLVAQAQEYAAAVPGPIATAGPALLTALRQILAPQEVHPTGGTTYRREGEGTDPVLVLPGGPLLESRYLGTLGGLADRTPLAVVDLPRRRVDELVDVVEAVRADLGLERADLLAHSAGAVLALAVLAEHPDRVRRLVLVCPAVGAAGVADDPEGVAQVQRRRAAADEGYAAALRDAGQPQGALEGQRLSFGAWSPQHRQLAVSTTWGRQERLAAYYAEPRPDPQRLRAAAAAFPGPVTVLHGADDRHPTGRQARELAALFPQGEAVELAGAGHYPWLDDAEAFGAAVGAALGR